MTIAEAARAVLADLGKPARVEVIRAEVEKRALYEFGGNTPEQSLYANLVRRSLGIPSTRMARDRVFYREAPNTFGLIEWLDERKRRELEEEERALAAAAGAIEDGAPEAERAGMNAEAIRAFVARLSEKRLVYRREAADRARRLLDAKLDEGLSEEDLRELFKLLNADYHGGREQQDRYGLAFTGALANKIIGQLEDAAAAIRRIWKLPDSERDEAFFEALDAFYEEDIPGAGRSLPTALLHIKAPSRFFALMPGLARGYVNLTGRANPRGRSSAKYRSYVEGVRALVAKYEIAPELVDCLLAKAAKEEEKGGGDNGHGPGPVPYAFHGFTRDAFAFLAELRENNRQDWFRANKARFRDAVDRPLRALITDLGAEVAQLDPNLETTPNNHKTIAKIRKNVWGKKETNCYHPYYWGAFYRGGRRRASDAQLYAFVSSTRFDCGFYIGTAAGDVKEKFIRAVEDNAALADELLAELGDDITIYNEGTDRAIRGELLDITSAAELAAAFRERSPNIGRIFEPSDAIVATAELVDAVWATFQKVYPFFLLATSDDPAADIEAFRGSGTTEPDDGEGTDPEVYTRADLLRDTLLDPDLLDRIEALLADKRQLVLYGPPGTGKTYVGERVGRYLAGANGDVKVVQFHPSYSYEDFIEGIRPTLRQDGRFALDVHDGIFKRLCDQARKQPKSRFVLVIDEINRGNLPRIFGELLYLLENRGSKVELPSSKKAFSIPDNLVLIGTMNSADHSIALVDFALRRRFHFVYFAPQPDLLRRWLKRHRPEMVHAARMLERLNERLGDEGIERELLVGHSHFMRPNLSDSRLRLIWEYTVEPLLEEYFYDRPKVVDPFRYEMFLDAVEGGEAEDAEAEDAEIDEVEAAEPVPEAGDRDGRQGAAGSAKANTAEGEAAEPNSEDLAPVS